MAKSDTAIQNLEGYSIQELSNIVRFLTYGVIVPRTLNTKFKRSIERLRSLKLSELRLVIRHFENPKKWTNDDGIEYGSSYSRREVYRKLQTTLEHMHYTLSEFGDRETATQYDSVCHPGGGLTPNMTKGKGNPGFDDPVHLGNLHLSIDHIDLLPQVIANPRSDRRVSQTAAYILPYMNGKDAVVEDSRTLESKVWIFTSRGIIHCGWAPSLIVELGVYSKTPINIVTDDNKSVKGWVATEVVPLDTDFRVEDLNG